MEGLILIPIGSIFFSIHITFGGQRRDSSLKLGACNGQATARMQASSQECVIKKEFSYFSTEAYVVGTQKDPLNGSQLFDLDPLCFQK